MGRVRNLSGANSLSVQILGENNILAGIGDILLNFLWILIFVITFFWQFFIVTYYQLLAIFDVHQLRACLN